MPAASPMHLLSRSTSTAAALPFSHSGGRIFGTFFAIRCGREPATEPEHVHPHPTVRLRSAAHVAMRSSSRSASVT